MIVLVCGGRAWADWERFKQAAQMLPVRPTLIIEGGAKGADRMGRTYAVINGIHYATVPALWDTYGNRAGPLRNSATVLLRPEYCLAMPGGSGTADMKQKASAAGIPVWAPWG